MGKEGATSVPARFHLPKAFNEASSDGDVVSRSTCSQMRVQFILCITNDISDLLTDDVLLCK